MIAVCDANVLASGFLGFTRHDSTPGEILRRWRAEQFTLVYSERLLQELERTFSKPYFQQRRSPAQHQAALSLLVTYATLTDLTLPVNDVAPDPDDDHVLAAAISAKADYLVTGDRPLQSVGTYEDVQIVSPRHFLDILDQSLQP